MDIAGVHGNSNCCEDADYDGDYDDFDKGETF
jgi:hypothetical protein